MCGQNSKNKLRGFTPPFLKCCKLASGRAGFTLIELLLAVTIFSIVASVIYSSFRLGIASYRRIEENLSRQQSIRSAMNILTNDLQNAFLFKTIPFKGEQERIEFAGLIKANNSREKTVGKICYFYSNPSRQRATGALMRQEVEFFQAQQNSGKQYAQQFTGKSQELLSDVMSLTINYCYKESEEDTAVQWVPEWIPEEKIPKGVRIELILKDDNSPDGKVTLTKRISIPAGEIGKPGDLAA